MTATEDLTVLFVDLQKELKQAGIGTTSSLEDQYAIVESDLRPYFTNIDNLHLALRTGGLTYEHAFFRKTATWTEPILRIFLAEYHSAEMANPACLFERLIAFFQDMDDAYHHVVSIAQLEADKSALSSLALARSCLRDSADIIESSLQPFLRLRRDVREIAKGSGAQLHDRNHASLGQVLRDFISVSPDIYKPLPLNVSLSDIRNIAYHGSYRIERSMIVCSYGNHRQKKEVRCEVRQLLTTLRNVNDIYYVHKIAFEFYCVDKIRSIFAAQQMSAHKRSAVSDFSRVAVLAYGIVASGFRILNAARQESNWIFSLIDLYRRSCDEAKRDFQRGVIPYLINSPVHHFTLFVGDGDHQYQLSFGARLHYSNLDKD